MHFQARSRKDVGQELGLPQGGKGGSGSKKWIRLEMPLTKQT